MTPIKVYFLKLSSQNAANLLYQVIDHEASTKQAFSFDQSPVAG